MPYLDLQQLSGSEFKRLCGVSRETFVEMVAELRPRLERQGQRGGQPKLSVEDQLLVVLEYWREYRSQFHIGVSWGLHETTVGRLVRKVEDILGSVDISAKFNQQGSEINQAQEIPGCLLKPRKDPTKVLEFAEPALN